MSEISKQTATDIAMAYREVEVAESLLADVRGVLGRSPAADIRDAFGRPQSGLELGVPSGDSSKRLFRLPYTLAVPVIEAHIANQRAIISALTEKARIEMSGSDPLTRGEGE